MWKIHTSFNNHLNKIGMKDFKKPTFIRVAGEFYQTYLQKDLNGTEARQFVRWTDRAIKQSKGVDSKTIIDDILKNRDYLNFQCVPSHTDYRFEIPIKNSTWKYLNTYSPIIQPASQSKKWDTIRAMLQHLFREQYEDILDYLQIAYHYPLQKQFVIALVGRQTGTGKTTFINFITHLFGNNVVTIPPEALHSSFNSVYAEKLFICIDESKIEKDAVMEKVKSLTTQTSVNINTKYGKERNGYIFAKVIMCSNNEEDFVRLDEYDRRYWVRKIEKFPLIDHNFDAKIKKEIGGFINFLKSRPIPEKKDSTFWMDKRILDTEQKKIVQESSKPHTLVTLANCLMDLVESKDVHQPYYLTGDLVKRLWEVKLSNCTEKHITNLISRYLNLGASVKVRTSEIQRDYKDGQIYFSMSNETKQRRWYKLSDNDIYAVNGLADDIGMDARLDKDMNEALQSFKDEIKGDMEGDDGTI